MDLCIEDITIVLPTKNESNNITGFIESLPPNIKLIVVDNSEDETTDLITYLKPDSTRIFNHDGNIAQARHYGSSFVNTKWILFTDADINFEKSYFENISKYGIYDAVYGPKLSNDIFKKYYKFIYYGQIMLNSIGVPAATGSNILIRKNIYDMVGGFDVKLVCNEDSEIVWRLKKYYFDVKYASDLIVFATDHRRVYRGKIKKTIHSLARCSLLYLDVMPQKWKSNDWGYWKS